MYDTTKTGFSSQFTNQYVKKGTSETVSQLAQNELQEARADYANEYPLIAKNAWQQVSLPHTANVEPLAAGPEMWQGVAYYKKQFSVDQRYKGHQITIEFEAAMQQSDVWLNGKLVMQHKGGYTPFFYIDCKDIFYDKPNEIIVRVDSHAAKNFPAGKDLMKNGFNYWSGIYRNAWLTISNPVHITNAVQAQKVMGGGVFFFRTPEVSKESATALIKTNVANQSKSDQVVVVKQILKSPIGAIVATNLSAVKPLAKGKDMEIEQQFKVAKPLLWSPDSPNLYTLNTIVLVNGIEQRQYPATCGF
ncbi:sugar-binding domain-containing protein [Pedobacter sp. NJ-S-72]